MTHQEALSLSKMGPKILGEEMWAEVQEALKPEVRMGLGPRITGKGDIPEPINLEAIMHRGHRRQTPVTPKRKKEV